MNKIEFGNCALDYFAREAFKALRTNIQFCGKDVKAISVTSCIPNEGKTTICAELSKSLAEGGKKVLLVDADMRNSVMTTRYSKGSGIIGLSQYLSGQAGLSDILFQTQTDNLFVVFSGAFPPNPAELLNTKQFSDFIEDAKTTFDYIIVDTPPLGLVTDAAIAASVCKNTVLVIGADKVKSNIAIHVKDILERSGTHILGVILNHPEQKNKSGTKKEYYYKKYL